MTIDQWIRVGEIAAPCLCLIGAALIPAWVKSVIRKELAPVSDKADDALDRVQVLELWHDNVKEDVRNIPRNVVVLERLDGTLDRVDATLRELSERFAAIEAKPTRRRTTT